MLDVGTVLFGDGGLSGARGSLSAEQVSSIYRSYFAAVGRVGGGSWCSFDVEGKGFPADGLAGLEDAGRRVPERGGACGGEGVALGVADVERPFVAVAEFGARLLAGSGGDSFLCAGCSRGRGGERELDLKGVSLGEGDLRVDTDSGGSSCGGDEFLGRVRSTGGCAGASRGGLSPVRGDAGSGVSPVGSSGRGDCGEPRGKPFLGAARGPRWERNHGKKMRRKERKMQDKDWRATASPKNVEGNGVDAELRESSVAKWKAQNFLAAEKASRELAVLKANDVESEVRRYRAKVTAATERQLVSIETTHAKLAASGNVPGEVGSVETLVSGAGPGLSSGTISPNSSASMAEYWAVKKQLEVAEGKLQLVHEKFGVNPDHLELWDKDIWTENTANEAILGEMYPHGYGMDANFTDIGKFRVIPC